MKLSPRLREFIQVDIRQQDIPGTNRYYKKQPKVGRWREITPIPCCAADQLTYTPLDVTASSFTITVLCDGDALLTAVVSPIIAPTTDINDVVAMLKRYAKYIGKWATDGTVIELQLFSYIALNCSDAADLTFTVEPTV